MLDSLNRIDTELLLFFNGLNSPFFDFVFYWISNKWFWIPLYTFLAIIVYKSEHNYFFLVLIVIAAMITFSDQITSSVIKQNIMRLRPCNEPLLSDHIHLVNNHCGGKYGFVSSHAANAFALAIFLVRILQKREKYFAIFLITWAIVVSYSRIYLGVHYPGDILGGAFVGIFAGYIFSYVYRSVKEIIKKKYPTRFK